MLELFILATYMVNEARSILENLVEMHVNVPQFLIAGLDVTQKLIDSKTNIKEETKSEEIIYQSTDEGQTDEQILQEREKAIVAAKQKVGDDVEVIDSFFKDAPHDAKPLWFLGKSLELLASADVAYFAPEWDKYRGCKIEHECAVQYGIATIESEE